MKNMIVGGVIVFAVGMLAALTARSQGTLYLSNLGQPSAGTAAVASDSWVAAGFWTGNYAGGYALNSVQLAMAPASGAPNGFTAMLYSAGNTLHPGIGPGPESSLGTLSGSTDPVTGGLYTYAASGLTLAPSTAYFIVATAGTSVASGAYAWTFENSAPVTAGGWGGVDLVINSSDGSSWNCTVGDPQFALTATAVPEPETLYLMGLPGLLFVAWRRWHMRRPKRDSRRALGRPGKAGVDMKNMIVCVVIVLMAALLAAPAAQAQFNYTTNNGAIIITRYTGSGGSVIIPDQITGLPVTSIGDWAFYSTGVINVTISDTVTKIGDGAFFDCESLTNVTIGDNLASIGDWAFAFCSSLTNVNFRGNSPALGGTNVFYGDSATVNYLPGTAGWGPMFGGLAAVLWNPPVPYKYTTNNGAITITKYTGPGAAVAIPTTINFLPVTSIGYYAFFCTGVINVTIPDTVTNIGLAAFGVCESLTNVTIGANVASIGAGAFGSCVSLTNLTLPASVTSIGDGAFDTCVSLTNLTIPGSVTSIGDGAFSGCSSLPSVTIPAGVTNIGEAAFAAAPSLAAIGVSARCGSLTAINVVAQNAFYRSINGVLFDKSAGTLLQYPGGISGGYTIPSSVTSIASEAFFGAALTSVTIPGSVTNFGNSAFAFCTNLTNVTMANGVPGIGGDASLYVFQGCSSLTNVTIPGSVTNLAAQAFAFCRSLTSVYFQGNAPVADSSVFAVDPSATAYYLPGTTGWSAFSANTGRPVVLWNPLIQTGDGSFGVQNNQFGFNITGTTNIPIVVQACSNLASPVWTPLQSLTLTNGSYYFSEPFQPGNSGRYYRISSQ